MFLPILAFLLPEMTDADTVVTALSNLAGVALIIASLTELAKKGLDYDPIEAPRWLPKAISVVIGGFIGLFAFWLKLGIFAEATNWFIGIITGVIAAGLANGWYNYDFAKAIIANLLAVTQPKITQPGTGIISPGGGGFDDPSFHDDRDHDHPTDH